MKYVYGLIILALSLSQFMAMGRRPGINNTRHTFEMHRNQNLMRQFNVRRSHPQYDSLEAISQTVARIKRQRACRGAVEKCTRFGNRAVGVFSVLAGAKQSVGINHIAGAIVRRTPEIISKWEPSAQEGAGIWLDGFTGPTTATVNFRVNRGTRDLLEFQNPAVLSESRDPGALIDAKRRQIERDCRNS